MQQPPGFPIRIRLNDCDWWSCTCNYLTVKSYIDKYPLEYYKVHKMFPFLPREIKKVIAMEAQKDPCLKRSFKDKDALAAYEAFVWQGRKAWNEKLPKIVVKNVSC